VKKKRVERFTYEGLGFPVVLVDVPFIQVNGIWTPAINYNELQKDVLLGLCHKPAPFSGNEVHFIRSYFEMTFEVFAKRLGVRRVTVVKWEKARKKPAKIKSSLELLIRHVIFENCVQIEAVKKQKCMEINEK